MYIPAQFHETRVDVMHGLMRANPLAALVTLTGEGLDANHLPLYLVEDEGEWGALRGHVSRANPLWNECNEAAALAIFRGPEAYVTPSWYPSKHETGKAVPTWNYAVVHAHGTLRVRQEEDWIRRHLHELTHLQESGRAEPWQVSDAPEDFIQRLAGMVVGIEITISRLEGKWKVSQNQPPQNRQGVVAGLRREHGPDCPMASLIQSYMRQEQEKT